MGRSEHGLSEGQSDEGSPVYWGSQEEPESHSEGLRFGLRRTRGVLILPRKDVNTPNRNERDGLLSHKDADAALPGGMSRHRGQQSRCKRPRPSSKRRLQVPLMLNSGGGAQFLKEQWFR